MELYGIDEEDIEKVISNESIKPEKEGNRFVTLGQPENKFKNFPLKIVFVYEGDEIVIISAYPLKRKDKGVKNESKL